jgi:hypothetical protein
MANMHDLQQKLNSALLKRQYDACNKYIENSALLIGAMLRDHDPEFNDNSEAEFPEIEIRIKTPGSNLPDMGPSYD